MKQVLAVILAAIIAGLAACEIATTTGIRGIPANVNSWLSGEKTPVLEAAVTDTAKEKAKDVVAKVKDAAEKAVEAAKPADHYPPAPLGEPGSTSYFGGGDTTATAAWNAEATMNPDYAAAAPSAATEAPEEAASETPDTPEPETATDETTEYPPAPLGEPGVTSFFGKADTADADQPWAAPATVFETPSTAPAEATPEDASEAPASDDSVTSDQSAVHDPAPLGEPGVTSFFGTADKPDSEQPWAAPATVFEAPAAAPAEPASEDASEAPASEDSTPSDPSAMHDPAPLGEPGATSFFGSAEKADADQPWAAAATVYADAAPAPAPAAAAETAAPASAESPEVQQAVEACRDSINGELPEGMVTFALGSWDITPEYYAPLDRAASAAKGCQSVVIEINGHADDSGKESFNQTLSEFRAQTVMRYLVKEGVDPAKLKAVGYGQANPAASNDTAEGRAKNRRIEVSVKPQ